MTMLLLLLLQQTVTALFSPSFISDRAIPMASSVTLIALAAFPSVQSCCHPIGTTTSARNFNPPDRLSLAPSPVPVSVAESLSCLLSGEAFGIPHPSSLSATRRPPIKIIPSRSKSASGASASPLEPSHSHSHSTASAPTQLRQPALHSLPPPAPPSAPSHIKQQPSSPSVHSPSTVQASPFSTPRPHPAAATAAAANGAAAAAEGARSANPKRTNDGRPRSSIACDHCRKSKVKCVNTGQDTVCEACVKAGRTCTYNSNTAPFASRRETLDPSSAERPGEAPRSKRRKIAPSASAAKDTIFPDGDILDPKILTPETCLELFDIFEQHFASDLSFLHAPTFKETLKRGNFRELMNDAQLSRIYAFLALTAPFHPAFARASVTDERNRSREAVDNAKQYAKAAHAKVTEVRQPTLETIQALLMLAFHEWSNLQGARSFRTLSSAITDAQALGCHYQDDLLGQRHNVCAPPDDRKRPLTGIEKHIEEETKRRIFWSCYIMDSYFCSTKRRPAKIKREDIQIQLPCSERAFKHGKNIKTRTLYETDAEFNARRTEMMHQNPRSTVDIKWEDEDQQETLCWYIRSLGIWRQITYWACEIARLNETHPPWDKASRFYGLRTQLEAFIDKLPEEIRLLPSQTRTHIEDRTSRSYTLLHSVLAICDISLHREYLPFAPFGVEKPNGPIDPPLVKGDPDPPDYWDKSAQRCFKAARDIIELMWACNEAKVLVHTPLTGFAIYSSLFTVVWVKFFPKFDTAAHLCSPKDMVVAHNSSSKNTLLAQNSNRATTMLNAVQMRVKMVTPWINTIHRLHSFFVDAKAKYRQQRQQASNSSPSSNSSSSPDIPLPDLAIYQKFFEMDQKQITEYGRSYEGDEDLKSEKLDIHQGLEEASATCSPAPQKSEDDDNTIDGSPERTVHQQQIQPGTFTAVNTQTKMMPTAETPKSSFNGAPAVYPPYQPPGSQYTITVPFIEAGMAGQMSSPYDPYGAMPLQQPGLPNQAYNNFYDPNTLGFNEGHQLNSLSTGNEQNTEGTMPIYQNSMPYQPDWASFPMYPSQPSG